MYVFLHVHTYTCGSTFSAENLPRLQPRFYSAASSPLVARQQFKIVFSVTELPDRVWNSQKRYVRVCVHAGGWVNMYKVGHVWYLYA